ncbi:MAG: sugar phosphate isomerase/epimerase [Armatimonadetes bacterium]|nr:sugar phosphate isomerase/epimerase [Armatimonadota bacterium]
MLLSVCVSAFAGTVSEQLAAAAEAGFEAVELRGLIDGQPITQLSVDAFGDVCQLAAEYGLMVATVAVGQVGDLADNAELLRRVGAMSALNGARIRLFSSMRPGVSDASEAGEEPPAMLWEHELKALARCVDAIHAEHAQALVMVESEPVSVANTVALGARLLADLDRPNVGLNWDFVNCWMAGEHPWPGTWVTLRDWLYGVHYKGAKADPFDPTRYASQCLPGDDDIPHRSIWATLAAVGFDGPVTIDPNYAEFRPVDWFEPEPEQPDREIAVRTLPRLAAYRQHAWAR